MLEPLIMNYMDILERIRDVVRQNMESKLKESDEIDWDVHFEILLFYSMLGLKPVGVNRYFMMTVIHERFSSYIRKELPSKLIWDHLESLYDMAALHESEIVPFPNEEVDFELPEEVDEMVKEKFDIVLPRPPKDENEAPKNIPTVKSMKKLGMSKLKQATTLTANAKNTFLTPVSIKSTKNYLGSRSEPRPPSEDNVVKGKQESLFSGKVNKVKRSSSPFTGKNLKSETVSVTPESAAITATPVSSVKKSNKTENHNSSSAKKNPKSESTSSSSASKKSSKQESNSSSSRQLKTETPDNSSKKVKNEKENSSKKGKVPMSAENSSSKKNSKSDTKKTEAESNNKKSNDSSSSKPKADKGASNSGKGHRNEDSESSVPSGSRKSSAGKIDTTDKKKKRQKVEESTKKVTPAAKRRRTLNV